MSSWNPECICDKCKDTGRIWEKRGGVPCIQPCPHCPPDPIDLDEGILDEEGGEHD